MKTLLTTTLLLIFGSLCGWAQSGCRLADRGDGTYENPIIYTDYSDPDLIRVGEEYWMTASSFNCVPGLPILHSTDLVNWALVNHALKELTPCEHFDRPAHGDGVWAPSIRYHEGVFYIYWGDPDYGIYMVQTDDPRGEWSKPHLVKGGKGMIDPCPLWDEDGRAYLVHGWAGSRAGFKSVLSVVELSADGRRFLGEEVMIFDGHAEHPTIEGPKFYKRNGYYYIFAPAGGVKPGWQVVLRARSPYGPYECQKVLHQGNSSIPGPHQGGWVEDTAGESWFMHFVDMYAYGRVVHLQPMEWLADDWCRMGVDQNGDGIGEPVERYRKPAGRSERFSPADSDEFEGIKLGCQWQWHANTQIHWGFPFPSEGLMRLYCRKGDRNLWQVGNLLLQKVTAPDCEITTRVVFHGSYAGDRAGLVVMGRDYATLGFEQTSEGLFLVQEWRKEADRSGELATSERIAISNKEVWLRCRIEKQTNSDGTPKMVCRFSYSLNGAKFRPIGQPFTAREGRWIGAKVGYYATAECQKNDGGWLDADWFRVEER